VVGGHFLANISAKTILDAGYWWPTLIKDMYDFWRSCDSYPKIGGLKTKSLAKI